MENAARKKVMLSGIQPSGDLTLGSLPRRDQELGASATRNSTDYYFMADMHAITVRQDPGGAAPPHASSSWRSTSPAVLDPEKNTHVHPVPRAAARRARLGPELLYACSASCSRMTQFKDKSAKNSENINGGLFTYPALMAADILLYQPDYVPVGEDQKQHVELCRNIVQRFNGIYGDVFKMPEPYIPKVGARVMSLSDPGAKMSKSDKDPNGSIYLMEKPEDILRKFKRAVTDSDTENCVRYDPANKPGVANLMTIYSAVTGKSFDEIEQEFAGKGYGAFKPAVGEAVVETLRPIREEATRILGDKAYLESVYRAGAQKASYVAEKTLRKVYKKVGFVAR